MPLKHWKAFYRRLGKHNAFHYVAVIEKQAEGGCYCCRAPQNQPATRKICIVILKPAVLGEIHAGAHTHWNDLDLQRVVCQSLSTANDDDGANRRVCRIYEQELHFFNPAKPLSSACSARWPQSLS